MLNSNRLRTFEDARVEIVTYVETKFGLRISDSKLSETELVDILIQWMWTQSILIASGTGKGKGSSSPRDGCFKCGRNHF